jgi:DNA-binding NtrC family response regulator
MRGGVGTRDDQTASTRVLIADDDPVFRGLLATVLAREGYAVQTAADGRAALTLIATEAPDLLIADVVMPGLSGWSLLARARRLAPQLRTLLISGVQHLPPAPPELLPTQTAFLRKSGAVEELLAVVKGLTTPV